MTDDKGDRSNMVYDLVYFDTSVYVHGSAASINELTRRLGTKFGVEMKGADLSNEIG